jgi:hypothetical protein
MCAVQAEGMVFSEDNVEYLKQTQIDKFYYLIPMKWGKEFSTNN